ncbi:hypothetical protein GCM10009854_43130 [Saccharopolyspora halophila]|uniref:Uncharacterized protein n=1 Tax=Saccharopolyspora halophila TaxID=405551 RepID=A0ABN3GS46_9PSEU
MRLYAERPVRLTAQVLFDLAALAWIYLGYQLSVRTEAAVLELRSPGYRMIDAGAQLGGTFADASRTASTVPFAGDRLADVLGRGTAAGDVLTDSGHRMLEIVELSASATAVLVGALALLPLLALWLPRRIRYARTASRAVNMREHAVDVLALRALAELPHRELKTASSDPAAAWRAGDSEVIAKLAGLRLSALGLRPPRTS